MITRRQALLSVAGMLTAGSVACQTEVPRGTNSGRIDPSVTTDAEINDARILPVSLMEFADQAAQEIAQKLVEYPEIAPGGARSTMILGDIQNKTGIVASDEFELVRSKIRSTLLASRYVRGKIAWVENRARLAALAAREGVGTASNPAGPDAYDPRNTFTLNMDVYRINRGNTNLYYMEAHIVNFSTNEILLPITTTQKQVKGG